MNQSPNKNYFTIPNEIFSLGLDASEIAVYAYLRCLENRSTYQCWPSYATIGNAVGISRNTVRKYKREHQCLKTAPQYTKKKLRKVSIAISGELWYLCLLRKG